MNVYRKVHTLLYSMRIYNVLYKYILLYVMRIK